MTPDLRAYTGKMFPQKNDEKNVKISQIKGVQGFLSPAQAMHSVKLPPGDLQYRKRVA